MEGSTGGMAQIIEFASNHPYLVGSLVGLTALVIVNEVRSGLSGANASPADAVKLINAGALVLDVRPSAAFQKGHIIGARNIPVSELADRMGEFDDHRDRPILVCCDTGMTTPKAAGMLRKSAFSKVVNLKGGLAAWERESLPLDRAGKKPGKKGKRK
jgi:rhodanese-related sulfurtransferase